MNRLDRANIPDSDSVLNRIHSVISGIQRSSVYGNLDPVSAETELDTVLRNLQRLEGSLPDREFKSTIDSISSLREEIRAPSEVPAKKQRLESSTPNTYGKGRNKLVIDIDNVQGLISLGFNIKQIAENGLLGGVVHPNTIYQRLKENGTAASKKYSSISDENLQQMIKNYNSNHPNSGAEEVCAFLKTQGLTVQRDRCRQLLNIVDGVGTAIRWSRTVQRRHYSVPMANSLWHIDSHHSLIRWNIIVHGGIDGKSRLVTYLRAATCNTSKAACLFFIEGVRTYGVPSRVRADNGTENLDVGAFMKSVRGEDRGSFITGKSVHNQRIETLERCFCEGASCVLSTFLFYGGTPVVGHQQ